MRVSRKTPNVMRDVLAFLFRHWKREVWLVSGIALSMVTATIADLFMPVFAGPDLGNIHGLNEYVGVQTLLEGRDFLYRLVKVYADQK